MKRWLWLTVFIINPPVFLHFIRPGTDAALLAAMLNVIFEEKLNVVPADYVADLDKAIAALDGFTPERAAAVTGIDRTPEELMRDGERICNLEKAFNSRLGLRREHDTVCERWMWEPNPEGMYPGAVAADMFNDVLDEYYEWRGWERESGLQTRARMNELGLEDVADVLEADQALAS